MSMSILISININMDMKRHMLVCIFISMLVGKERGEIVIRIIDNYYEEKKSSYKEGSEVIRLGNEEIKFGNVLKNFQGQPYEGLCKIKKEPTKDYYKPPTYQFFKIIFIGI
jgi:hypothetical protein